MENETVGAYGRRENAGRIPGVKTQKTQAFDNQRAVYKDLLAHSKNYNIGSVPTLSYLRFEVNLTGSMSAINFQVLANQGTPNVTENRLQLSDMFSPLSYGFFIEKVGTSATFSAVTDAEKAAGILRTFPDPKVFTGGTTTEAAALQAIYNGYMSLKISNNILIPSFPMLKFYRVPDAQATINFYSTGPTQQAGWSNENWGMIDFQPSISLMGSQNINLAVTLPTAVTVTGTSSSNVAVFLMYGYLLQNGAQFNSGR